MKIGVVNFGSSFFTKFEPIIKSFGHEFKEINENTPLEEIKKAGFNGIILSGSPKSAFNYDAPTADVEKIAKFCPVLGVCYGAQLTAQITGGSVKTAEKDEHGEFDIELFDSPLFYGIDKHTKVEMHHNDRIYTLGKRYKVIAKTKDCPIAAMERDDQRIFGVQFHPEIKGETGLKVLDNFINKICR